MEPLEKMEAFPYLGRTVVLKNSDLFALYGNLRKAQRRWVVVANVLTKTGMTVRSQALMYKVVAHRVIIYSSKSWVVMKAMLKMLEGFHHWVARRIAGMSDRNFGEGGC